MQLCFKLGVHKSYTYAITVHVTASIYDAAIRECTTIQGFDDDLTISQDTTLICLAIQTQYVTCHYLDSSGAVGHTATSFRLLNSKEM